MSDRRTLIQAVIQAASEFARLLESYDPDEPRDEHGQWTDGGKWFSPSGQDWRERMAGNEELRFEDLTPGDIVFSDVSGPVKIHSVGKSKATALTGRISKGIFKLDELPAHLPVEIGSKRTGAIHALRGYPLAAQTAKPLTAPRMAVGDIVSIGHGGQTAKITTAGRSYVSGIVGEYADGKFVPRSGATPRLFDPSGDQKLYMVRQAKLRESLAIELEEKRGEYTYEETEVKRWVTDADPCDICEENADRGWVGMDEGFATEQFGIVDGPPGHTNCLCSLEYGTKRKRVYVR